jgi:hypothetical protein
MGGSYSLYGRRKDTEKYVFLQDLDDNYMQVFKHNAVAYAQDKKHELMKAIYLYHGQLRLGKAYVKGNFFELTFQSAAYAAQWDSAWEEVSDVPWLFRNFTSNFKPVQTDYDYMRVYRKN